MSIRTEQQVTRQCIYAFQITGSRCSLHEGFTNKFFFANFMVQSLPCGKVDIYSASQDSSCF